MTAERDALDEAELAARFRDIAFRTAWNLDDEVDEVVAHLWTFHSEITDLVSSDEVLDAVLRAEPLAEVYAFAVSLAKVGDISHPGRLPSAGVSRTLTTWRSSDQRCRISTPSSKIGWFGPRLPALVVGAPRAAVIPQGKTATYAEPTVARTWGHRTGHARGTKRNLFVPNFRTKTN